MNTTELRSVLADPEHSGAYFIDARDTEAMAEAGSALDYAVLRVDLADCPDKAELMKALRSVALTDTPRGQIRFDNYGNVVGDFYVRHIEMANGKLINKTVKTYKNVSQFWTYDEKKFLEQPVYSRNYPPLKS